MYRAKLLASNVDIVPKFSLTTFEPDTVDLSASPITTVDQKTGFDTNSPVPCQGFAQVFHQIRIRKPTVSQENNITTAGQ